MEPPASIFESNVGSLPVAWSDADQLVMAQTFALSVTLQAETGHRLVEHVPQLVLQAKALGLTLVALVFVLRRIHLGCTLAKGE